MNFIAKGEMARSAGYFQNLFRTFDHNNALFQIEIKKMTTFHQD
jgi:hypothetical protein